MKIKTLGFISLLTIASFSLTGCGSEKLTCSLTEDSTKIDVIMKFKGDEINYLWLKASIEVPEVTDETKDVYSEIMKQYLEQSEEFSNLKNYKNEWKGNTLIITADWSLDDNNSQLKKKEAIQLREAAGFQC